MLAEEIYIRETLGTNLLNDKMFERLSHSFKIPEHEVVNGYGSTYDLLSIPKY